MSNTVGEGVSADIAVIVEDHIASIAAGPSVGLAVGGFQDVTFFLSIGLWTDADHAFTLEEAPDVAGAPGSWTAVAAGDISGQYVAITDNTREDTVEEMTYLGNLPWVRINTAVTNTPIVGAFYTVAAVKGNATTLPA